MAYNHPSNWGDKARVGKQIRESGSMGKYINTYVDFFTYWELSSGIIGYILEGNDQP